MKYLNAFLAGIAGLLVGAVVGFLGPFGVSNLLALLSGGSPGGGAPTAFALLCILTIPGGAILGCIGGVMMVLERKPVTDPEVFIPNPPTPPARGEDGER